MRRVGWSVTLVVVMLTGSARAQSSSRFEQCRKLAGDAQRVRDEGKLIEARKLLLQCVANEEGTEACDEVILNDCDAWLKEIDSKLPSVVPVAKDEDGNDVLSVSLTIDGGAVKLDGRAISLDPGTHTLRWSAPGYVTKEQKVLVREGEKNRRLEVVLVQPITKPDPDPPAPPPPPPPPPGFSVPTLAWVLGGAAVAGGVAFAALASSAKSEHDRLLAECAPSCPQDDVDAAKTELLVGNVMLGVGIAAALAAVVVTLVSQPDPQAREKKTFSLHVSPQGAAGAWMFRF